jgi:biotin-(acetyl-CoA carboxylase) ligase
MTGATSQAVTIDRDGHPFRHFPVAVSAGAMGLAWSRQEAAPDGACVLVDYEINALGRLGRPWATSAADTLAFAVVLRPALDVDDADLPWLLAGLGVSRGIESFTGSTTATIWPDLVVARDDSHLVASVLSEAQLAPGRVRAAVVTVRIDLPAAGVDPAKGQEFLSAVLQGIGDASAGLADDHASAAAGYEARCALVGRRAKVRLRPHGETRGEVSGVDVHGRLELRSATGMVERITVDMLRDMELVS